MDVREYRLVVRGELNDHLDYAFPGMELTRVDGTTAIVGMVHDQAELHGHLGRIAGLGLTLLSVKEVDEPFT
jgi:hypothetical protein